MKNKTKPVSLKVDPASREFLSTPEWRELREIALRLHGDKCQCCGAVPTRFSSMNVDHIKPRTNFPKLALQLSNLQILCKSCNFTKGNQHQTDYRPVEKYSKHWVSYVLKGTRKRTEPALYCRQF